MIVYIDRIPADGLDIEGVIPSGNLGLAELEDGSSLTGDVAVKVRVTLVDGELLVRGSWRVAAEFVCSRCLDLFRMELEEPDLFYDFEVSDCDSIDLTERFREDIILHFPVKPLCSPTCGGLCPECGARLDGKERCECRPPSVDPRLAALDRFRKKGP